MGRWCRAERESGRAEEASSTVERWRGARGRWLALGLAGVLGLGALGGAGCANRPKPAADDYSGQAKYNFDEAMDAYEDANYIDALKRFRFVRTKYPYSKYAALAALRVGDVYFMQEKMIEAVGEYNKFIQLHPTHPDVPYAYYRIGLARYSQLPGDWFFMPPAYEKDLDSAEDAERDLKRFMDTYPNTEYAEEIAQKLRAVRQRLADHEFYVATFYLKRDEPRAAAMRFEQLLERYPGLGFDQESLFLLGKSYLMLNDVAKAVETWDTLIAQFPKHALARTADAYINRYDLDRATRADGGGRGGGGSSPRAAGAGAGR